jgi:hypothetical protein
MTSRSLVSVALIIGFSAIAIFGAFAMGDGIGGHNACIAATVNGGSCLAPSNLASTASFYLNAFSTFSSAFFATLSLLILFVTAFLALAHFRSHSLQGILASIVRVSDVSRSLSQRPALSWIAIHENSPSRR